MKPDEIRLLLTMDVKRSSCLECALCRAINYEEKRVVLPQITNAGKALYGAEAQSYYFYFSAHINRFDSATTRPHRVPACR